MIVYVVDFKKSEVKELYVDFKNKESFEKLMDSHYSGSWFYDSLDAFDCLMDYIIDGLKSPG